MRINELEPGHMSLFLMNELIWNQCLEERSVLSLFLIRIRIQFLRPITFYHLDFFDFLNIKLRHFIYSWIVFKLRNWMIKLLDKLLSIILLKRVLIAHTLAFFIWRNRLYPELFSTRRGLVEMILALLLYKLAAILSNIGRASHWLDVHDQIIWELILLTPKLR